MPSVSRINITIMYICTVFNDKSPFLIIRKYTCCVTCDLAIHISKHAYLSFMNHIFKRILNILISYSTNITTYIICDHFNPKNRF